MLRIDVAIERRDPIAVDRDVFLDYRRHAYLGGRGRFCGGRRRVSAAAIENEHSARSENKRQKRGSSKCHFLLDSGLPPWSGPICEVR